MNIYDLSLEDMTKYMEERGLKAYKAKQLYKWLYQKYASSFDMMSDLSKDLIANLKADFSFDIPDIESMQVSKDGTVKFLFKFKDGSLVESVLMSFDYGYSACISTQIGCNMACSFCASGLLKKQRDLSSGEIVAQVLELIKHLNKRQKRLSNIVVMGTGEPFDNYDNLMKALNIINDNNALAIGARHISISTCGLVNGIRRFKDEGKQYNLAISLHAPNDELRSSLMPINKAYPLDELFKAIDEYSEVSNRRITFEYLLLDDINDHESEADELAKLLKGRNAYINLIPYNSVDEKDYISSGEFKALAFYDMLKKRGVATTLRQKKGDDIDAACGQLRAKYEKDKV